MSAAPKKLFQRALSAAVRERAKKMPVLAILGPRQSGKTTLARMVFEKHAYVSLENYEEQDLARKDPYRFFKNYAGTQGIIINEVQRVPELLSYIQTRVDQDPVPGGIILTGSQNILMNQAISQTLAGRISLFTLLPFSIAELTANNRCAHEIETQTYTGGYPRIYAYDLEPTPWYQDYIETYVERDVRHISAITDLSTFKRFIRLCAGRSGQLLNIASLATDCGIDQRTAKSWLSVLEASYILFLLQPHHENFNKRLIKSPKLYFYDTGLACALLDIQSTEQLSTHYLRGNLIETMVVSEIMKRYYNSGSRPNHVYFWRDQTGNEIDCIINKNNKLTPIEIKASSTIVSDFFKGITYWSSLAKHEKKGGPGYIIYGGEKRQERAEGTVVSWKQIDTIFE